MDKRYQVFVSSTYTDLKKERQLVLQALMEMDCIPAGMELFPAADEEQWTFIKRVIDDCDYYMLIIGGRYGTATEDGISYTEKEYKYALEKEIPIIALVHGDPGEIPLNKSEASVTARKKLDAFRGLVCGNRLVKFWKINSELPGLVAMSLAKTIKTHPGVGWVRGDRPAGIELIREINNIRTENAELVSTAARLKEKYRGAPTVIEPAGGAIPRAIREAMENSGHWQYRGATGTWFRGVTLPVLASKARETNSAKEIWVEIIDPSDTSLLDSYARYRGMVRSGLSDDPWTVGRVRSECLATLIRIAEILVQEPLVQVHVSLGRDYSSLRYDLGDSCLVVTTEEPSEPALEVSRDVRHYETWRTELSRSYREGKELSFTLATEIIRKFDGTQLTDSVLLEVIRSFGVLVAPCLGSIDYEEVKMLIKDPKNRYD